MRAATGDNGLPTVGVLMLDTAFPRPVGDIGNAATFGGRVLYETVALATLDRVIDGDVTDPALGRAFLPARDRLVARGAEMLTTSCGLLVFHQALMAEGCPVPFTASALLALPTLVARHGRVGVLGMEARSITTAHLRAAGAPGDTPVGGLRADAHLPRVLRANRADVMLDPALATADVLVAGDDLLAAHPDLDAVLLECTNLPPYTAALRRHLGRPVYDCLDWLRMVAAGQAKGDGTPCGAAPVQKEQTT